MVKQNDKLYEIVLVIDVSLDEARAAASIEKISMDVSDLGGEVKNYFLWTKRHLAYPIRGKKEGQYFLMYAHLPTEFQHKKFERILVLDDKVLRYSIFKADKVLKSVSFTAIPAKKR